MERRTQIVMPRCYLNNQALGKVGSKRSKRRKKKSFLSSETSDCCAILLRNDSLGLGGSMLMCNVLSVPVVPVSQAACLPWCLGTKVDL